MSSSEKHMKAVATHNIQVTLSAEIVETVEQLAQRNQVDPKKVYEEALAYGLRTGLGHPILAHILECGRYHTLAALKQAVRERGVDYVIAESGIPPEMGLSLNHQGVREYLQTILVSMCGAEE